MGSKVILVIEFNGTDNTESVSKNRVLKAPFLVGALTDYSCCFQWALTAAKAAAGSLSNVFCKKMKKPDFFRKNHTYIYLDRSSKKIGMKGVKNED